MATEPSPLPPPALPLRPLHYRRYEGESDIPHIMALIDEELSEPYNYYTYRYFLSDWSVPLSSPAPPPPG